MEFMIFWFNQSDMKYPLDIDLMKLVIFNLGPECFCKSCSNYMYKVKWDFTSTIIIMGLNWVLKAQEVVNESDNYFMTLIWLQITSWNGQMQNIRSHWEYLNNQKTNIRVQLQLFSTITIIQFLEIFFFVFWQGKSIELVHSSFFA